MKNYAVIIIVGCLLAASPASRAQDSTSLDATTLQCTASINGQAVTATLTVDYGRKEVNGKPAVFTDKVIDWSVIENGQKENHELNKISGAYKTWVDDVTHVTPPTSFTCEKTPTPRF